MSRIYCCLALLLLSASAWAGVPQAFLIQNSGWMEPFYADPESKLKPLAAAVVEAVADPGDAVFIAAFNQSTPENESPRLVYPDAQKSTPRQAIDSIALAHKSKSGALADTDFQEAVSKIIAGPLQGKPGIIWIFTNNKNSPNNSPETAKHNQAFYDLLHHEPSILRTLVFPLAMTVKGSKQQPQAHGLMVYALAYGQAAESRLRELIDQGRARRVFTEPPARLKPLDKESVHLIPKEIVNAPTVVAISLADDQKTTVLDVNASDLQPSVDIKAALENLFYPYSIHSSKLSAKFTGKGFEYPLAVTPATLDALPPGARREVSVNFPIPHAQIPSAWSLARLGSLGTRLTITGAVEISLTDQRLELDPAFKNKLNANFKGDPLSDIFTPSKDAQSSSAAIPLAVRVAYPVYPIVILIGLLLLLAFGLLLALHALKRSRRVHVRVDGNVRKFLLKPLQTQLIRDNEGNTVGEIKRGLVGAKVMREAEGHRILIEKITD